MRITKEARCAKNAREYIGNRPRLVEGKIYTLIFRQQPERSEKHTAIKKRMRFLKAFPHQLTLTDLYELEKVQDIKKRNEILKTAVSSREIAWKAKQAVKEEKIKKNAQIVFEILEEKGVKAAPKRAKEEEKERIEKEFAEISQEKQMLILLTRTAEPYEATDYYGHYEKGMKCLRDFYRLLQQMGFSFRSLEELKILNGTHELYTQETEDEH